MTLLNFQLRSPATLLIIGALCITVGLLGLLYSTHNGWAYPLSAGVLLSIIGLHRLGREGADQHLRPLLLSPHSQIRRDKER